MAIKTRAHPLPLPGSELLRMKEYLAPEYGSEIWTEGEKRILVVRVPHAEPDIVRDIPEAVDYLSPGDVQGLSQALLVGSERVHAVPPQPFADLMGDRVRYDIEQAKSLRSRMTSGHLLYKAPDDPRKLARLAFRIAKAHVRDLDDADLSRIAEEVGPHLKEPRYEAARAVYLIADQDDVRIDAELFLEDIKERWSEEETRHQLAAQIVAREQAEKTKALAEQARAAAEAAQVAAKAQAIADRQAIAEVQRRPQVAYAPLKSVDSGPWEASEPAARPTASRASPDRARMYAWVDSLPASHRAESPRGPAAPAQPMHAPVTAAVYPEAVFATPPLASHESSVAAPAPVQVAPPAVVAQVPTLATAPIAPAAHGLPAPPAAPAAPPEPAGPVAVAVPPSPIVSAEAEALGKSLRSVGYDVLMAPEVPGHAIDVAAEREDGYPQRVIARILPRLTDADAQALLAAAKELGADLAIAVAEAADPEARKRIVATKVRFLAPADLANLAL
jgi:hypothetical protein